MLMYKLKAGPSVRLWEACDGRFCRPDREWRAGHRLLGAPWWSIVSFLYVEVIEEVYIEEGWCTPQILQQSADGFQHLVKV